MNQDGDFCRAVHPEGTHMASSASDDGAYYGAYLDDGTSELGGQTKFHKVDPEHEVSEGGEADQVLSTVVLVLALGIAGGVVGTIVVQCLRSARQPVGFCAMPLSASLVSVEIGAVTTASQREHGMPARLIVDIPAPARGETVGRDRVASEGCAPGEKNCA
ncbi:hypothetical protein E3T54_11830 [Cryobacterium sp. Sr8]|uniref:hypothetical protein n=1 Tax=Cryobacterium sp. Sr8 TaxID=1259203 RepID=UPI00106A7E3C|nr:hypothetical protein [Cryobacterium sp. Sr8]TFD75415.1 hypothetical protein E3T54_11830 [Cryobacterium sp. Sr8]